MKNIPDEQYETAKAAFGDAGITAEVIPHPRQKPPPPCIRILPFNELKLSTGRRYLVKGLIPRTGMTVVWGPPKCGKSFWLFDCLMHVALGWDYRGRRVHPAPVVYCAFEGQFGISARVEAFRLSKLDGHEGEVPFFLQPVTLDLVKDHQALIKAIRGVLGDQPPGVVALDTLNRSLAGSESSDEDMAAYIKAADAISKDFECAVAIVHHCGHNDKRMRGHSSLIAALDAELAVTRQDDNSIVVKVERLKDGQEGDQIVSKLESVVVGTDEDGEEITSCIVTLSDAASMPDKKAGALRPEDRLAMEALDAALIDHGQRVVTVEMPAGVVVVHANDWKAELYSRGILDRNHSNPSVQFKRLWQKLAAAKLVAQRDNQFWRANA